ncbi:MAG: PAS domain S-box protein, partial [Desulfobacterales bacterium]
MDTKPTYEELEKTIKELERRQDKQTEKDASYGQDLPQRKPAEEALRESEAKYLQLFNTVPAAIILYDAETKELIDGNDAAFDLYGYSREEFLNLTYWDITAEPEKTKKIIPRVLSGEVKRIPLRYQKKKDGTVIPIDASVGVFRLNNREVICGVSTDISRYRQAQEELEKTNQELRDEIQDRERAEKLLRESEEKYRLLVKNANDAIFIAQDDAVKFPNPKGEEMTGYSAEELAKMPFIDLIHPDDRNMVLDRHRRRLSGEKLPAIDEFRIINKAGEKLWVELNAVVINWEERPATLNLLRDITQQKKLEAQLLDTRKMEAISTLAGGIAHEFNN